MIEPVTDTTDVDIEPLLDGFHDWMVEYAGEAYNAERQREKDRKALADPDTWAWLSRHGGDAAGCIVLVGVGPDLAELARLWVAPAHRGHGHGRVLCEVAIERARAAGYDRVGLTTPPWAEASHALYESLGFERTDPYPETRLAEEHHEEAIFMVKELE